MESYCDYLLLDKIHFNIIWVFWDIEFSNRWLLFERSYVFETPTFISEINKRKFYFIKREAKLNIHKCTINQLRYVSD